MADSSDPSRRDTVDQGSFRGTANHRNAGDVSLEQIANRKDECVRFLEKRSLDLLCFTYSLSPERAQEFNRVLEGDMDRMLLDAHKQLAMYRLYGSGTDGSFSKYRLNHLETIAREAEQCYERFERAKKQNPHPNVTAIVPIFGTDDLEKRVRQSLAEQENVNKAFANLKDNCKRLLESSEHVRKMIRNLREQNQLIFFKHLRVSSLIDEVATFLGVCVRDSVAEDLHSACLSQAASEFTVESWVRKIKECQATMQTIRTEARTYFWEKESDSGKEKQLLTDDQRKEIQSAIVRNTGSILQLSHGAESLRQKLSRDA
ncbi:nucleoporin complex subunit 54, putative [Babesia ovata]|uniref:Nucleoporin complex subunit 54, putative n=1 Tax=Babesia ovata TaxID=189622 RepID=A0A2H6KBT9_9APIC|nr:nucleoporin complex subunit 54, putative [Babesia ovata]GBE60463.1 nucleoporin complex subunit 54, putative [Babesia ovata]